MIWDDQTASCTDASSVFNRLIAGQARCGLTHKVLRKSRLASAGYEVGLKSFQLLGLTFLTLFSLLVFFSYRFLKEE